MTAFKDLAFACILAGGLVAPAFAAPGDAGSDPTTGATSTNDAGSGPTQGAAASAGSMGKTTSPNGQGAMNGQTHIAQKMREDLSKAGFTDIQIMPSSFLVRAKNSSGNPVMMVINLDSVTAITEENTNASSANNSSHMGGTTSNSAGATPGPKSTGGSQPVTPGGAQRNP